MHYQQVRSGGFATTDDHPGCGGRDWRRSNRALTRLAVAHDDLIASSRRQEADKLKTWADARLDGVRESIEAVERYNHGTITALAQEFEKSKQAAATLVEDVRAGDVEIAEASELALTAAFRSTRKTADHVRRAARRGQTLGEVFKWAGAVATSLFLAVVTSEYSVRQREKERLTWISTWVTSIVVLPSDGRPAPKTSGNHSIQPSRRGMNLVPEVGIVPEARAAKRRRASA